MNMKTNCNNLNGRFGDENWSIWGSIFISIGLALVIVLLAMPLSVGQDTSITSQISPTTDSDNNPYIDQAVTKGNAKFFIYVYYKNGSLAPGALVYLNKYVNGRWISAGSGYTGGNGVFSAWLDGGYRYKIVVQKNGQNGIWNGIVDRSRGNKIRIHMR